MAIGEAELQNIAREIAIETLSCLDFSWVYENVMAEELSEEECQRVHDIIKQELPHRL
ncbi:hypothetical protein SEA_CUCURBITA_125 [Gordonia phage Cucurbita]|uniref:Uncharacterized protein n=1 Tax=Gordonia phage Bachita TaxID=1838061 RepID=A0A160DFU5_9CAUD|nr:hypothetical protein BH772_gp084 [Gordonia phage Bachita]YP_009281279.1 hypothetical protein BIZ74_gp080 [Gordonia phage Cucurbita]AUE23700.1 hypothetical protein SEA_TONIANN_124 [Gordonia phage Toniann]QKY79702.1 hypothetical protein SEA_ENGINEER_126 [Gordonia Phage Engineer]WKW85923.1 hypothetical protein SEA_PHINKBODEN_124 [Gordonia Phage PhinkBoden]ANA86802.1 hypothetical protein PBI_BACHITA_127 [Gordonia phage Bachita]AOE44213.1 hypothetical protein SEA_CUCURBITA_125 [Gordonia phage C